ncbi:MAG: SDR family NAD(P)-dependent oxidoreductase [Alteromonas sp.]|jgi:short-subunit dehydrogenase|uniref:SDR family NAD(P)-dependent oxidoreductase n=1 Tax=Alteromonas sp. TaxID=232 RepID=UPI0032D90F02
MKQSQALTWKNKRILITGAGSGIGHALATLLAKLGASLILTDINKENLSAITDELGNSVLIAQVADVSAKADWQKLAQIIEKDIGSLDVLVNNAGISTFGLITIPMLTPYHTSKFAIRGFSEALRQDMAYQKKTIDVLCVLPGGIKTNIAKSSEVLSAHSKKQALDKQVNIGEAHVSNQDLKDKIVAHFDAVARTSASEAAKVIERGMRKKTPRILIGSDAKLVHWLYKFFPSSYDKLFNPLLGIKKLLG